MFNEHIIPKAENHNILEKPKEGRKWSEPKYSCLQFVDGYNKDEVHHQGMTKKYFQEIHFEGTDCCQRL